MDRNTLVKLLQSERLWTQVFEEIRLIQADGTNRICEEIGGSYTPTDKICYHFWNRNTKCSNCVSKNASCENKQMIKLEYSNQNYYFVIARPMEIDGKNYILELITNITKSLSVNVKNGSEGNFINDLISELETVSKLDLYTKLYNKTYLEEEVSKRLKESREKRTSLYMCLMDLDKFKTVNDTKGHDFGDKVILDFSNILKKEICLEDGFVSRYGGDEFAIVFNDSHYENVIKKIETICKKVAAYSFDPTDSDYHLTVSYGIMDVSNCMTYSQCVQEVDEKLYKQKDLLKK